MLQHKLYVVRPETWDLQHWAKFITICLAAMVKKGAEEWHYNKISWKKLEGVILLDDTAECCNTSWRNHVTLCNNWKIWLQHYKKLISTSGNDCNNKKIVRNVCGRVCNTRTFSHNLCHNKIAKQVAGKIAKCNKGLKERWSFGIRRNMAKCGFNLLFDETEWLLATGIEQSEKWEVKFKIFMVFRKSNHMRFSTCC